MVRVRNRLRSTAKIFIWLQIQWHHFDYYSRQERIDKLCIQMRLQLITYKIALIIMAIGRHILSNLCLQYCFFSATERLVFDN